MRTGTLTIINDKGATIRTAPNTGGGSIRLAKVGTVLDFQGTILLGGGDVWAILTENDPTTARPWRYGSVETVAFVAVYVKGVEYCKLEIDQSLGTYQQGWNDCRDALIAAIPARK